MAIKPGSAGEGGDLVDTIGDEPAESDAGSALDAAITETVGDTPVKVLKAAPIGGFTRLTELPIDIFSAQIYGFEGTGKTIFWLKGGPLPMAIANLDRPLTQAHLGVLKRERAEQIFFKNLREGFDALSEAEAVMIKDQIEQMLLKNLDWLRGGTFMIDGGTLFRDVLKLADPKIGPQLTAKGRFNPKDKASVNAYIANLMSWIQDKGINLVMTSHAAWSWEMQKSMDDQGNARNQLVRTKQMYPKQDDICFERSNLVLLMFKRCQCGANITSQDGTCSVIHDSLDPKLVNEGLHQGRRHCTRIVTNKFATVSEGSVWEDLDWATLQVLCNPKKAADYIEAVS